MVYLKDLKPKFRKSSLRHGFYNFYRGVQSRYVPVIELSPFCKACFYHFHQIPSLVATNVPYKIDFCYPKNEIIEVGKIQFQILLKHTKLLSKFWRS